MPPLRQGSNFSFDASKRQQLPDSLEQENFNLKLRIYHLEERLAQQYPGDVSELVRLNAELNAQLDIKNEAVQQRDLLLVKARNVIETLQNDIELLRASNGLKSDNERNSNQDEIRRFNLTINQLSSKLQESEQKLKSTESELKSLKEQLNEKSQQLEERVSEYETARNQTTQYDQVVSENNYLKGTIERLKQQLVESQESCSNLKENLSSCLLKLQSNDTLRTRIENDLMETRSELNKAKDRHSDVSDRLRIAELDATEKHSALLELEKKYSESSNKISRLESDLIAYSKREAALLDELEKWKSLSQSQHEDKQHLELKHHQSFAEVQKSVQSYSNTLSKLSSAIESVVQCLQHLRITSIPLRRSYNGDEDVTAYNDDDRPPKFDANDPERAALIAIWIENKIKRIARIRSSLKITISQVEEHWTEQFNRLEQIIKHQDQSIQDTMQRITRIHRPDLNKKGWGYVEDKLHLIARELDASFNQLRTRS